MRRTQGFSLVELLISLAIIMAITAVATGIFQPIVQDQQVDVLKANLRALRQAVFEFYNDNNRYPYEGQDEFGNVVTFLDDNTSELVQGRHLGAGVYPDPRHRYLLNIPGDPTLDSNQIGWKLIFRETFNVNTITPSDLASIPDFQVNNLANWLISNRPFSSAVNVQTKLNSTPVGQTLQPTWGIAYTNHDVRFTGDPLRVRMVTNVKSLNTSYSDL